MTDYRGKTLLLVSGGLMQYPAVEIAKSMGLRVLVTDRNANCACAGVADELVVLDTKDVQGHVALAKERKGELAAVFTCGASVECTVAEAADAIGLPGLLPEVAYIIADKYESHLRLMQKQVWGAGKWFGVFSDFDSALECIRGEPYPFVVKPVDSSGSRGLTKIYRAKDFTEDVFARAIASSTRRKVLLQGLLEPRTDTIAEQSCETVWYNGKGYWLNWVDRPFLPNARYAIERGHYNPAMHDAETQKQVEDMVLAAGKALGMTTGIFKADVMLTKEGPRILETTARLSGGFDSAYTSPLAHGVDYIRGAMKLALGEPIDWNCFLPRQYRHAVALAKFPLPGRIKAIRGVETARFLPKVDYVFVRKQVGDVIPEYTDCVERPVFVIASGDARQEAIDAAEMALAMIHVDTEAV